MSIEVLAIALSSSGLCCEINDPTRRPLAQKLSRQLKSVLRDCILADSLLMPYTTAC